MSKINVLIVDDHQIFRDGIESLFSDIDEINIIGVAINGKDAIDQISKKLPDITIMDISMPDMSGIEVMEYLKSNNIKTKVLVLSMHTTDDYIFKAIRAGASGYLPKEETTKSELIKAIKYLYQNQEYFSDTITDVMKAHYLKQAKNDQKESKEEYESLSKREKEVLKLVIEGLTNSEMADKLFVNIRTIETHKTNILQKLNLKNSVELVKFAIKNKLLEL